MAGDAAGGLNVSSTAVKKTFSCSVVVEDVLNMCTAA